MGINLSTGAIVYISFTSVFVAIWLIQTILILGYFRKTQHVVKRHPKILLIKYIGSFCFANGLFMGTSFMMEFTKSFIPLWLNEWLLIFGFITYSYGYSMMCMNLVVNRLLAHFKSDLGTKGRKTKDQVKANVFNRVEAILFQVFDSIKRPSWELLVLSCLGFDKITRYGDKDRAQKSSAISIKLSSFDIRDTNHIKSQNGTLPTYVLIRHLLVIFVISVIWTPISQIFLYKYLGNQGTSYISKWLVFITSGPFFLVILACLYLIRHYTDSLGIKREITLVSGLTFFSFSTFFVASLFRFDFFVLFDEKIGSMVFALPIPFLGIIINTTLIYKSWRESRRNPTKKTGTKGSDQEDLLNIISNPVRFKQLKKSMAKDLCMENAIFLEDLMQAYNVMNRHFSLVDMSIKVINDNNYKTKSRDLEHNRSSSGNVTNHSGDGSSVGGREGDHNSHNSTTVSTTLNSTAKRDSFASSFKEGSVVSLSQLPPMPLQLLTQYQPSTAAIEKPLISPIEPENSVITDIELENKLVRALYRQYIKNGSANELNISDEARSKVTAIVTDPSQNDRLNLSLLDEIKWEVATMIITNNLDKYLKESISERNK